MVGCGSGFMWQLLMAKALFKFYTNCALPAAEKMAESLASVMAATAMTATAEMGWPPTHMLRRRRSVLRDRIGCAKHRRVRLCEMWGMSLLEGGWQCVGKRLHRHAGRHFQGIG